MNQERSKNLKTTALNLKFINFLHTRRTEVKGGSMYFERDINIAFENVVGEYIERTQKEIADLQQQLDDKNRIISNFYSKKQTK